MNQANLNKLFASAAFLGTSYMAFKKERQLEFDPIDTKELTYDYLKLIETNQIIKPYKHIELKDTYNKQNETIRAYIQAYNQLFK